MGPILHNKRPFMYSPFWSRFSSSLHPWIFESMGLAEFGQLDTVAELDTDLLSKAHDDWIEHIKTTVPKEKLLIHKSADGFVPICKHLGISADNCPPDYPYVNDATQMRIMLSGLVLLNISFWPLLVVAVLFFIRCVRYGPPKLSSKSNVKRTSPRTSKSKCV